MRREVRTQAELDEALAFTDVPAGEWLYIDIVSDAGVWLEVGRAAAYGSSTVRACDSNLKSERGFAYPIGETVECPDWTETNDCGGGLHLSPHTVQALAYFQGATRFLRCTVDRADLRPIPGSPAKAKARRVTVVEEVSL